MTNLSKNEVATWIRSLIPYLENPVILSPKGCFNGNIELNAGKVLEYEEALMPISPQIISQTENLKALIELYKIVESEAK